MSYASRVVEEQLEDLKSKRDELQGEATTYDRLVSKLYHELEGEDLETETGMEFAKRLQKSLRERRKVKYNLYQIKTLINQLENTQKKLASNEKDYFKDSKNYKQYIS